MIFYVVSVSQLDTVTIDTRYVNVEFVCKYDVS